MPVLESQFLPRTRFNDAQWQAVSAQSGHMVIGAAAGTGKTTTMAARILYLQAVLGVSPSGILAVTFSRAARAGLTERLQQLTIELGRGKTVKTLTLHGLSYRIISHAMQCGETWLKLGFEVIRSGRDGVNPVLAQIPELLSGLHDGLENSKRALVYSAALDLLRQGRPYSDDSPIITPDELEPIKGCIEIPFGFREKASIPIESIRKVWRDFNRVLRRRNLIDYSGMVAESLRIMCEGEITAEALRKGLRFIMLDELQDTSKAHLELLCELAGNDVSINAVGDEAQTIYAFNGSDPESPVRLVNKLPTERLTVLPCVRLSENYRSSPNVLRVANRVLARMPNPLDNCLVPAGGDVPEPVRQCQQRNFAVTRVRARRLEDGAIWVASEIRRLIETERVRPQEIAVLFRKDTEHSPHGRMVSNQLALLGLKSKTQIRDPEHEATVLNAAWQICVNYPQETTAALASRVVAEDFGDYIVDLDPGEVASVLAEAEKAGAAIGSDAAEALYEKGEVDQTEPTISGIQVRSIHSAKGLEFRVVFVLYTGDRDFPSGVAFDEAEERRLFYVAVTRAQERLYIVGRTGIHGPSFFDEIDGEGVRTVEAGPPLLDISKVETDQTEVAEVEKIRKRMKAQREVEAKQAREEAQRD